MRSFYADMDSCNSTVHLPLCSSDGGECCAAAQALQMTGGAEAVRFGPCDPASWHPDLEWLAAELSSGSPPRMVVLVNPCNPTGAEPQRPSRRARDSITQLEGTTQTVQEGTVLAVQVCCWPKPSWSGHRHCVKRRARGSLWTTRTSTSRTRARATTASTDLTSSTCSPSQRHVVGDL